MSAGNSGLSSNQPNKSKRLRDDEDVKKWLSESKDKEVSADKHFIAYYECKPNLNNKSVE